MLAFGKMDEFSGLRDEFSWALNPCLVMAHDQEDRGFPTITN